LKLFIVSKCGIKIFYPRNPVDSPMNWDPTTHIGIYNNEPSWIYGLWLGIRLQTGCIRARIWLMIGYFCFKYGSPHPC
jgi:hypothetical protein